MWFGLITCDHNNPSLLHFLSRFGYLLFELYGGFGNSRAQPTTPPNTDFPAQPTVVATGNPGCLMQIGAGMYMAGMGTRAMHPVDLLDEAYATGIGPTHVPASRASR